MTSRSKMVMAAFMVFFLILVSYVGALCGGWRLEQTTATVGGRLKCVSLYSLKGTIYDKDLSPLTNGKKQYYLLIDPRGFSSENTQYIADLCRENIETLSARLNKETVFILTSETKPTACTGVYVFEGVQRYQGVASHLIGYVDGNMVGVTGLEKCYNSTLSYFGGAKEISYSTDGRRNPLSGLGITVSGEDGNYKNGLITTLDIDLQQALQTAMKKHIDKGAAVILDIESGEILALASYPDFDADNVAHYLEGTEGELINRALVGQTVGSVFKIVVAAAAIEAGIDEYKTVCKGSFTVDGRDFACPRAGGHGEVDMEKAFADSCNGYFIALGQMLGSERLLEMAQRLGFGESMEIAEGLAADGGTLPEVIGESPRQLANLSIGQGDLLASPLQIARLLAVCGNGGYLVAPTCFQGYLVDGVVKSEQWLGYRTKVLDEKVAERLRQLCVATVESGTGAAAMPERGGAGGKTSSAQTGVYADDEEVLNTYFAGFYPAKKPQYAMAVFAQGGDSGGQTCAPVFKEVCDYIAENS